MRYFIEIILLVALCGQSKVLVQSAEVDHVVKVAKLEEARGTETPITVKGRQQRQLGGGGQPVTPPTATSPITQQGILPIIGTLIGNLPAGWSGLQGSNWMALPTQLIQGIGNLGGGGGGGGGGLPLNLGGVLGGLGNLVGSGTPTCPSSQTLTCRCEPATTARPATRRSNLEILQYSERNDEDNSHEKS